MSWRQLLHDLEAQLLRPANPSNDIPFWRVWLGIRASPVSPDADGSVPHRDHAAHPQRAAVPVQHAAHAGARPGLACN